MGALVAQRVHGTADADQAYRALADIHMHRLVLIQPECPGDAIATDRILDLEFATPIKASDVEPFLQDGIDT